MVCWWESLNGDVFHHASDKEEVKRVLGVRVILGTGRKSFCVIYGELAPVCVLGDFGRLECHVSR